jgi:hypothetical protein
LIDAVKARTEMSRKKVFKQAKENDSEPTTLTSPFLVKLEAILRFFLFVVVVVVVVECVCNVVG